MDMCGYHLRCLNYGNKCLDCSYQHNDKNGDYLNDVLRLPQDDDATDRSLMSLAAKYQKKEELWI
jgi:hypothetical protein